VSRRSKSIVLAAVIAAIVFVLISPLPELDASRPRKLESIAFICSLATHGLLPVNPAGVEVGRAGAAPISKEVPDVLAILCCRHC
jgi:hypothetical protein